MYDQNEQQQLLLLLEQIERKTQAGESVDESVFQRLQNSQYMEVRHGFSEMLYGLPYAMAEKYAIALLKDEDTLVRVNACDFLSEANSPKIIDILFPLVKKEAFLVRGYAVMAIGEIAVRLGTPLDIRKTLLAYLQKEKSQWVKLCYAYALYLLGCAEYLTVLLNALNDRYYQNRSLAVHLLADVVTENNQQQIFKKLLDRLQVEPSFAVKDAINKALKKQRMGVNTKNSCQFG